MTQSRQHISGTAHIVFGPGPTSPTSAAQQTTPPHHHHHHHQDHRPTEPNHAPHFWAIMPSPFTASYFVLEGIPHPLGSYPPDIPEPHGCMPPHLYYTTTVYEHTLDASAPKATWTLPYVHRLGDGRDDAGGLTSAYQLLVDHEDADDFGTFIGQLMEEEQREEEKGSEDESMKNNKRAALYACTNILVGESRILGTIQKHFFEEPGGKQRGAGTERGGAAQKGWKDLPQGLAQLKRVFDRTVLASLDSDQHPFSLCISDLQLVLPKYGSQK